MDAPIFESSCSAPPPKLREGECVEVNTGLRGCWHPATIVGLKPGCRIVDYDELLTDDGLCKLRESIPSTKCMQKFSFPTSISSPIVDSSSMLTPSKKYGFLRPASPLPSDTCQPDDLSKSTGCSSKSVCEESGSLKCFDDDAKQCSVDTKGVHESSAMQTYVETFQEPSQSSCVENSTAVTSSFTLLTDKLTATSGIPRKIEMSEHEGLECAKGGVVYSEPSSDINLHKGNKEAVCETEASEAVSSKEKDCIETSLGRSEVIDPTVSQRSGPETESPCRKVGVLLALPASLPSSRAQREEEASMPLKLVHSLHVKDSSYSRAVPNSSTLRPLLPTCDPPEEWTTNLCRAELGKTLLTRGRLMDRKRGSSSQKSVKEVDKNFGEKGVKISLFPADVATFNSQGQADSMSEAKQDELGSSTGEFESGRSSSPVNHVHWSTQPYTDNGQQTEKADNLDYPEERSVNCSTKFSRGRPSRHERDTKSIVSKDVLNGFQKTVRKTQEILAMGHRMKRKATDQLQERVVSTGLRDKHHNHGRLFEGKMERRSENDTLMSFRDRLVLQRKQAEALKRKAMESKRGCNQREKNEKSVSISNKQNTMELKPMSSIMVLRKQTVGSKRNTMESRRRLDQEDIEKKVAFSSQQSIMEPKPMSNMTSSMVKDKTLKSLTRDIAKEALLEAGFRIDLRRRKSRDYHDSVYISPDGHAYWSLPKAWEALKKLQAEQPAHKNGQRSSEDLSLVTESHEKAAILSMNGEEKRRNVADADNYAVKEVFSRFGNDERLQSALTKRGTCSETSCEMAQNSNMQADLTNADLTDILLGDLGLLRRLTSKFVRKNNYNQESSESITLRSAEADNLDKKRGMKRKRDTTTGLESSKQKTVDRRGSSNKSQGVLVFKARDERKQGTKKSLKQTMIETKATISKHKAKKGEKPKARSGTRLEVRRSSSGGSEEPACHSRTIFAWMIDRGAVLEKEKILFWDKGNHEVRKDGVVTREGILCSCCKRVFSVDSFEAHAVSNHGDWHQALVFTSGKRLLDRLLKAWDAEIHLRKAHNYVGISMDDTNDDTCLLCGDGGDLICCDGCPSTFHSSCLQMDNVPDGDWYCPKCSCGICGVRQRVEEKEDQSIIVCSQCEHRYHTACLHDGYSFVGNEGFCRPSCKQIFSSLRGLVGVLHSLPGGFSWSLLRCMEEDKTTDLSQSSMRIECHSKLAVALLVIKECFNPMVDPRTNIDMITHAMYNRWSDFDRLNYAGFYTAVLEKEGEIISVATIRIHGVRLAEMPLIGTREKYRRQGMCRLLVSIIEKLLASLQVAFFILPAISELFDTWTLAFGFKPLDASLKAALQDISMMVFPETELLQKPLFASPGMDFSQDHHAES